MRGKGTYIYTEIFSERITPAHAGKRIVNKFSGRNGQDHPRTCGEKIPKV